MFLQSRALFLTQLALSHYLYKMLSLGAKVSPLFLGYLTKDVV